jgi:serine/threonine protein kinase
MRANEDTLNQNAVQIQRRYRHGAIMSSRRIGNYQITDYVGSGGFGSVFKAEDVNTPGRIVAIKELHKKHTRNQVIKQRFFQEAVAMARLDHPNLPRLFTFGEDNGSYFLVMEFISGKLLSEELHNSGAMRPERAVLVLTQVLDAVNYAHRNGIIHRDLKPDNIMLIGDSNSGRIKVLDFGIARMIGGENLTLAGEGFGTPTYMAPERMSGAAGDDPRMDLYAAGIILFEMLSGKAPFESKATDPALYWVEMREMHERTPLPSLKPFGLPADLEQVAMRATAKRLDDRYQSAEQMLEDLKKISITNADAPTVFLTSSRLSLTTTPGAAEVYVDEGLCGTSDASRGRLLVEGLTPGLHSVRVLKEGFNEYKITVALEDGKQTDLQVALAARATVAMPRAENTAAGGLDTVKLQPADETKTAILLVENLPVGTTVFVGSEPVGHADDEGRATLKLVPGSHEIRATAPTGATATRVVSLTPQEGGALKTMSFPLAQTRVAAETSVPPVQARRGKQVAAAAAVILLLALAATAYFVLRGPDRTREQVTSAAVSPAAATSNTSESTAKPAEATDNQQASEDKKKAAEAKRQTDQEAAAVEAQKKATEAKEKTDKKEPPQASAPEPSPKPAIPPPAATEQAPERPVAPGRDGCFVVTVLDVNGQPVSAARVMVEGTMLRGRTGPKGHWQECGVPVGKSIRVLVFGPRGAMVGSQTAVAASRTFVTIRLDRAVERASDDVPQVPGRKRPYQQKP